MSVLVETSIGDLVVDLYVDQRPRCCMNFLKLCKLKYYNLCLFHSVQQGLVAQTGDPTGTGQGGSSVLEQLYGAQARYFDMELKPKIRHRRAGLISMVNNGKNQHGSQFFFTLADDLDYLDGVHTVFGEVAEGVEVIRRLNETICDNTNRPYKNIRIFRTSVLEDPFPDPERLEFPPRSPEPPDLSRLPFSDRLEVDDEIDEFQGLSKEEIDERIAERDAQANAQILEIIGDLPAADVRPDESTLFVCKLNPVTTSEDLEIIFSRFGEIRSCEVIKDPKTNTSLQYAFIEFSRRVDCEEAYFKMENVLIDDRRIHVDFSQSVAKEWHKFRKGGGRGSGPPPPMKRMRKGKDEESEEEEPDSVTARREKAIRLKDFSRRNDKDYDFVFDKNRKKTTSPPRDFKRQRSPEDKHRRQRSPSRDRNAEEARRGRYRGQRSQSRSSSRRKEDHRRHHSHRNDGEEWERRSSPQRHRHRR